uniref:restriction endonuclease subunit S n=1 Tax=Rhizobium fredii TaxID=380 RepID=UPI0005B4107B
SVRFHPLVLQSDYFEKKVAGDSAERYLKLIRNDFVYNDRTTKASVYGTIKRLSKHDGGIVSPIYKCFRFNSDENPVFWEWHFESGSHEAQLGSLVNEGARAGRFNISISQFLTTYALRPDEPEQKKIADCLTSVDELIVAQARKVETLKTHKKGVMQHLFPRDGETRPRLRFPEFRDEGDWRERKIGSVCEVQRGRFSHRPRNDPAFFGGKYPFIQTGDVVKSEGGTVVGSQSLNERGLAVSKLFKPTIVLITIAANIGDTGLLTTEACFTDSVVGLIPKRDVIPVFLELVMRGKKEYLNKVATTGAQKNINNDILREVDVLLPSITEQQRIADFLTSLDDLIAAESQKLDTFKTHKKGLMQQLFPAVEEADA